MKNFLVFFGQTIESKSHLRKTRVVFGNRYPDGCPDLMTSSDAPDDGVAAIKSKPDVTVQAFASMLQQSGLLAADAIERHFLEFTAAARLDPQHVSGPADDFAEYLRANGTLTDWQSANLLRGRFRGLKFGKFRVLRMLGAGGMGRVFLAENELLERQVALKVLPKKRSAHASSLERFRQEAKALAKLSHQNIVGVYDIDVAEDRHYIVMEFVDGSDLQRRVRREGPIDGPQAIRYLKQVAAGLDHAHAAGLIHRDIKPANLLLDPTDTVKISDLGLALLQTDEDGGITADPTKTLGTADYISPEQALNSRDIDARTDLYSLGCTLYFLLTGRPPFASGTNTERLLAHQLSEPEPINSVRQEKQLATVDPEVVAICQRLMAKQPDDRFASAAAVLAEMRGYLGESSSSSDSRDGIADLSTGNHSDAEEAIDQASRSLDSHSIEQLQTIRDAAEMQTRSAVTSKRPIAADLSGKNKANPTVRRKLRWIPALAASLVGLTGIGTMVAINAGSESDDSSASPVVQPSEIPSPSAKQTTQSLAKEIDLQPKLFVIGDNTTVHREGCYHLRAKTNTHAVSPSQLGSGLLKPCRTCKPF
ncbi:MAG: serine/threonine-protein kinase [Planctomycetota bacterium]